MDTSKIELKVDGITEEETIKLQEILVALINSGAWRLRNGKAMLHFDSAGTFQGIEMDYWAFRRRSDLTKP